MVGGIFAAVFATSARMRILILALLFLGALMVADGIYEQRLAACRDNARIEYRFIPRSYYDEQMHHRDLSKSFEDMFNMDAPWTKQETILPGNRLKRDP